jgi:hypothetical protein
VRRKRERREEEIIPNEKNAFLSELAGEGRGLAMNVQGRGNG